jgi:hypothetical protein
MNRESQRQAPAPVDTEFDEGGDPVCWAHLVCPECGLLNATRHPHRCEGCGASFLDLDES